VPPTLPFGMRWIVSKTRKSERRRGQISQCDVTFPKENICFYFNHLRDSAKGLRSQKDREFKIF
jgi:hypothetical protein